jgi:hypothetical protein
MIAGLYDLEETIGKTVFIRENIPSLDLPPLFSTNFFKYFLFHDTWIKFRKHCRECRSSFLRLFYILRWVFPRDSTVPVAIAIYMILIFRVSLF